MKVIKVIVDELPVSCNLCPFSLQDFESYFCCTREILKEEFALTMSNMIHKRPDWCPLSQGWISVEDRLPEGCSDGLHKLFIVAVRSAKGHLFSFYAWFDGIKFYSSDVGGNLHDSITHWQPLPSATK